jgi:hypothetical protein
MKPKMAPHEACLPFPLQSVKEDYIREESLGLVGTQLLQLDIDMIGPSPFPVVAGETPVESPHLSTLLFHLLHFPQSTSISLLRQLPPTFNFDSVNIRFV